MAKSSRASSRKANNQRLKKNVFGPIEAARAERLSAKLLELATQPKPEVVDDEAQMAGVEEGNDEEITNVDDGETRGTQFEHIIDRKEYRNRVADKEWDVLVAMDIDSGNKSTATKSNHSKKGVGKRRVKKKSPIVFAKYKDRAGVKKRK